MTDRGKVWGGRKTRKKDRWRMRKTERQRERKRGVWSGGVNMINPLPTRFRDTSFSHFQPH